MGDFTGWIEKDLPSSLADFVTKGDVFTVEKESFVQPSNRLKDIGPQKHERAPYPIHFARRGFSVPLWIVQIRPAKKFGITMGKAYGPERFQIRAGKPSADVLD